jgi:hypothetical protein
VSTKCVDYAKIKKSMPQCMNEKLQEINANQ